MKLWSFWVFLGAFTLALQMQAGIAADPTAIRGVIAEHCTECHRIPGFIEEGRNPEIGAPDFQEIADNPKVYTHERLATFLREPHFPMRGFTLSKSDIQNIIAFIESLQGRPKP